MKLGDIAPVIPLEDGESVTVSVSTESEITSKPGSAGGTVYRVPCVLDGKPRTLRGGERLVEALQNALNGKKGISIVRITARGAVGTLEREWDIVLAVK